NEARKISLPLSRYRPWADSARSRRDCNSSRVRITSWVCEVQKLFSMRLVVVGYDTTTMRTLIAMPARKAMAVAGPRERARRSGVVEVPRSAKANGMSEGMKERSSCERKISQYDVLSLFWRAKGIPNGALN